MLAIGASRVTNTMMLGWGVALAVIVDATVVRCLLVPSVLRMTGPLTWWGPEPLRKLYRALSSPAAPVFRAPSQPGDPNLGPAPLPDPEPVTGVRTPDPTSEPTPGTGAVHARD